MKSNRAKIICGSVALCFICLCAARTGAAQQPFFTDDADATEKGKFHLEIINEFDWLPTSSLPSRHQNGTRATLAYGLVKNLEVSVGGQFLALIAVENPRYVGGIGDVNFAAKYNFRKEREDSRLPALAVVGYVQIPTGDANRSLGNGAADYGAYGIAQKTFRAKNVFRANGGLVFGGNSVADDYDVFVVRRARVLTGGVSYVRSINEKLQLGAELTGARAKNIALGRGQLQTQIGGNYQISEKTTLDFGIITGRFAASPRFGFQIGFARAF